MSLAKQRHLLANQIFIFASTMRLTTFIRHKVSIWNWNQKSKFIIAKLQENGTFCDRGSRGGCGSKRPKSHFLYLRGRRGASLARPLFEARRPVRASEKNEFRKQWLAFEFEWSPKPFFVFAASLGVPEHLQMARVHAQARSGRRQESASSFQW